MSIVCGLPTVCDLLKGAFNLLKDPVVYAMSSKSFFNSLKEEVGKLENEAQRVEALAQAARNNVRHLNEVFTEWKKRADKASEDARNRWEAFEDSKSCCYGRLPNPYCHYKFSTEAEAEINVIRDLAQESIRFGGVDDICFVGPAPAPNTVTAPILSPLTSVKLRDRDVFKSRASMIQNIMDALADNSKSVVGVYGMGGVGKSTLLEDVKRILTEESSFEWVAKADVSKNPNIHAIQGDIAACLKLTDIKKEETISARAELLRRRLEKEGREKKKVLIMLDNLWEKLDLKLVGIPCGHDNKAIGCKLLLTSRDQRLLQREMGCDREFLLGGLEKEEARALFERTVGDKVHDNEFKPWVEVALCRCAGVPFLIVAMAKRFKNAELFEWKDALRNMEKFNHEEINGLIDDMLEWSYDKLKDEAKALLRLCVVYSVSMPSFENLVRCGFGLGLFQQVGSLEEATDRLLSHIRTLQASALLLDSEDVGGFKIHDLVREFVASVSLRDHHPLLVLEDNVKSVSELPEDKLESCEAMCFPNMEELPPQLNCPELLILLLSTNDDSLHIPDSYFDSMRKLMVLNLAGVRLTCSPSPFQFLKSLNTLCLQRCSLDDMAILGELKGLQILSIVDSEIQRLPKEIGQLVELRSLDLSDCSQLDVIEPGVLGSLIRLEELYMEDSFDQWSAGEQTPPTNASLSELNNMKNLRTLHVSIPDPSVLPKDLDVEKLTKYKIRIGGAQRWSEYEVASNKRVSRTLELRLDPTSDVLRKECIQCIFDKIDDLFLDRLNETELSICEFSQKGFPQLKHLQVQDSPSIHYILRSPSLISFKALESLILEGLINLEKICDNRMPAESFSTLKVVKVESCNTMKVLFPRSVVRELPQLEEIEVVRCELMRGIVEADDDRGKLELPKLRGLKLRGLPNIESFFSAGSSPSRSTSDDQVGTQIAFFNGQEVAFPSLETLKVSGLDNIGFMFSPSMVKSLEKLRNIMVSNCKKMEAIIIKEEGLGVEISETLSFPMLTDLYLYKLESLTCFSRKKCSREGQSQDRVQSRSSVLFNREVSFPSLDSLTIGRLPNLKEIWSDESPLESSNLRSLTVVQCDSLSKVISSRTLAKIHKLRTLCIDDCSSMQEIFYLEGPSANGDVETLSELTTLELNKLGSLRRIWNENPSGIVSFHKLKEFKLDGCDTLEFVFFPSMVKSLAQLRDLTVSNCKKMETIIAEEEGLGMEISKTLAFSMLTNLGLDCLKSLKCFSRKKCSREAQSQDRVNSHSAALFNGEVALPSLETLSITGMDNIEMIWDNQVVAESFPKLKSLLVRGCNKLVTVVPAFVLRQLKSMESLEAKACGSLEVVFGLQPLIPLDGHPVALPLKELKVSGLPKLKCVWDKELHRQVKFQRLRSVSVSKCNSLTPLFPASVTRDLIQLEELVIHDCGIAELIEKEEGLLVPRFVFPKLTSLQLKDLTELKHIYTGTHTSHWPALKTLKVDGCNAVEILASHTENEIPCHKQPLFLIERGAFPNLQEVKLDLCERMEIWHGNFHDEEFFRKLRVLKLRHLSKESATSTSRFIENLTNLEELVIRESYLEEPSSNVEAMEGPSQEQKVILPFSRQIKHLKALNVSDCDGLSSMFTPAIAENLVALTKLRISNCRILTEVVSAKGSKEGHEVAFHHLKCMELDGLIELKCFSSGGRALIFPLLEDVIVNGCPNMRFFSEGPIEAPKLERVKVDITKRYGPTKSQYFWEENLNMTIQNMFKEMANFVRLFEFPELIGKWHNEHNPVDSSWQIETLVVDKCPSFINAMPSKLMLVLEKMMSLHVRDCESLEEIFNLQGLETVESTRLLPRLQDLSFINLPKLRQLWNKDLQGTMRFNALSSLTLYKCSNLRHAFTPSMAWCLANISRMEIRECDQMEGVIEDEEGQGSAVEKISFPRLGRMILKRLPNLTSFLSGKNHALDCPKLYDLRIAHCPKMRSLTWQSSMDIDHNAPSLFTPRVQFHELRQMVLSHLDNLSKIWTDNPLETLTFDSLLEAKVKNCKSLENLFPHWVATSLTQLKKLRVESCRIEEIVANGDDTPHSNIAQVLFPKLTSLVLREMPRLMTFCPNLPTLNWQLLEESRVTHCDKLNMLSFAASMNKWTQRNDQQDLLDQEAHSSFERDFPNLERLLLVHKDIEMIQDGQYPDDIFGKSKALTMACFHEENAVFPSRFLLGRFQNLESLEVFCSSFEDIFPDEGFVVEERNSQLESLRVLKLSKLRKLKRVWREDGLVSKILRSIETLEVWDCPGLTVLFPAVTSFQNLTELMVKNSSGLVHLGTASAIASLVHLGKMTIIECERMKEIIAKDENEEGQVISFGNLEKLTLRNMPSLECFSSITSCILRFPSLSRIEVKECPKMKIFSKGTLSTPELWQGTLFRYKWKRDRKGMGDLNRIIQKFSA